MTQRFTTPCFISKNTPELREKLEMLGYYPHPSEKKLYEEYPNYVGPYLHTGRGFYAIMPIGYDKELEFEIYCGTNDDLFLALAALREDTDRNQLFVYDTTDCIDESMRTYDFFVCDEDKIEDMMFYDCEYLNCHKATVEELIEHFKTRNDDNVN